MPDTTLRNLFSTAIQQHVFPGCAWAVVTDKTTTTGAVGSWRYHPLAPPITTTSVFDLASLTKTVATAALAWIFLSNGSLTLQSRLTDWLPEYQGSWSADLELQHLLRPVLHWPGRLSARKHTPAAILEQQIFHAVLRPPLGEPVEFANGTSILLSKWLEKVGKQPLDALTHSMLWQPLGMLNTTFAPWHRSAVYRQNIVPTEIDPERGGELRGVVHDESTWALTKDNPEQLAVGAAGLFSTVTDLAKFVQAIFHQGQTPTGRALFSPAVLDLMPQGYGWETQADWLGPHAATSIGKSGFTGCSMQINLQQKVGLILLSNAIHPHRPVNRHAINHIRQLGWATLQV